MRCVFVQLSQLAKCISLKLQKCICLKLKTCLCLHLQKMYFFQIANMYLSQIEEKHVFVSICKKCSCLKLKKNVYLSQIEQALEGEGGRNNFCKTISVFFSSRKNVFASFEPQSIPIPIQSQFEKNVFISNRKIYLYQIENMVMNSGSQLFEMSKILHKARRCKQRRAVPELHPSSSSCLCHGH